MEMRIKLVNKLFSITQMQINYLTNAKLVTKTKLITQYKKRYKPQFWSRVHNIE